MRLQPPWPAKYSINARSPYGMRKHPVTGVMKMHHGVDVAMSVGTELVAPADGEVVHKGSGASGGNTLIIKHSADLYTVYYHLNKPSMLSVGASVRTGQLIAHSGNTGLSSGPHLHWETRRSKTWGDTFDPLDVLDLSSHVAPVVVSQNDFEQLAEAVEKPSEPAEAPEPVSETVTPKEPVKPSRAVTKPAKPSLLGKAAPSLRAWSNSWIKRGEKK